jgi:predicted amidohydrolase
MKLTVCGAQMEIENLDTERNLRKAEEFAKTAAETEGCHFLCFPELFITGALSGDSLEYAQTIPGPFTDRFSDLASRYGIHIVMGSMIEKADGRFYNTSVLIDDRGEIAGTYRKIFLWCGKSSSPRRARALGCSRPNGGPSGSRSVGTSRFPNSPRTSPAREYGSSSPTLWTHDDRYSYIGMRPDADAMKARIPDVDTEEVFINTCVAARAIENNIAFVLVNGCGKTNTQRRPHPGGPFADRPPLLRPLERSWPRRNGCSQARSTRTFSTWPRSPTRRGPILGTSYEA